MREGLTIRAVRADDCVDLYEMLSCPGVVRNTLQIPHVSLDKREEWLSSLTPDDYMMRLAVERLFGIIGEAMAGIARVDRPTAERITDYQDIIAFRNVIIHQYPDLNDDEVWDTITDYLPTLASEVDAILSEADAT